MSTGAASPTRIAAATALGLEEGTGVDAARAAFLRRVGEVGLAPSPLVRGAAAETGVIPHGPEGRAALYAEAERALAASVEEFADEYWDLILMDRRARWLRLSAGAERYPRVRRRLDDLAGGLDLVPPTKIGDEDRARLVDVVVELYPLKPAARARRRAELIPRIGLPAEVRRVAGSVHRIFPELRDIDHGLLKALTGGDPPAVPLRARPEWRPEPAADDLGPAPASNSFQRWAWVIVPICIAMCSGLARMSRTNNDVRPSYSPSYKTLDEQLKADRERLAKSYKVHPDVLDRFGAAGQGQRVVKIGLTPTQRTIVEGLISKSDLSDVEAGELAVKFLAGSGSPLRAGPPEIPPARPPDPRLTPAQRVVWDRLSYTAGLSETEVKDLLIRFARSGRPSSGGPTRP